MSLEKSDYLCINNRVDVDATLRYDNVTRPASTPETTTITTRRDDDSNDASNRRDAWEDAFDEVFGEELETVELVRTQR